MKKGQKETTSATQLGDGAVRYASDMRQIGALLFLLGTCSVIAPLPKIATLISGGQGTPPGIPTAGLVGSFCLCIIGILSVAVGYAQTVHDYCDPRFTGAAIVFTQTAFIPYITDLTAIGRGAASGIDAFGFKAYPNHSAADVRFVGAMGIFGVLCYGFTYVGSISFMQFAQYAYMSGKPEERSAPYYRGRQYVYCAVLIVAGLSQLLLGSYLAKHYGGSGGGNNGALPSPIAVAVYVVNFPGIAVFVGLLQLVMGFWGLARAMGMGFIAWGTTKGQQQQQQEKATKTNDLSYPLGMFCAWFMQLLLQIVVQISYPPAGAMAPMLAMIASMSVGLNLMPAYLDYKAQTLPEDIMNSNLYRDNNDDDFVPPPPAGGGVNKMGQFGECAT